MWYMKYYSALKGMKYRYMYATWMKLENIMLSERSHKRPHYMIPFIKIVQSRQIYAEKKQISGCLELGEMGCWEVTAKGYKVSFWGEENVLKLIVVMVAQLCEYTKNH